jgi:hypothetical protein
VLERVLEPDYDENRAASNAPDATQYGFPTAFEDGYVYASFFGNLYRYDLRRGEDQRPLLLSARAQFVGGPVHGTVYVGRRDGVWALTPERGGITAQLILLARREDVDEARLRAGDGRRDAVEQRAPLRGDREAFGAAVAGAVLPRDEAARLEPFEHAAERRAVERDERREARRVEVVVVGDRGQRRVLRRRHLRARKLFAEEGDRQLVTSPDLVPGKAGHTLEGHRD